MWKETLIVVIFTLVLFPSTNVLSLEIRELRIPRPFANGTSPYAVLDCDYTYETVDLSSLVVKWFFNSNPQPVYQWIPPRRPQALGIFNHRVDLDYQASDDNYTIHRALKIIQPTFELAGEYRCQVSSFANLEADKRGTFLVYVPAAFVKIEYRRANEGNVNISCVATGMYPKPTSEMFIYKGRKQSKSPVNSNTVVSVSPNGLYTVALSRLFEESRLSAENVFECFFSIPMADYNVYDRLTYYPGTHGAPQPTSHVKSLVFSTEPSLIGVPTVMDSGSQPSSRQVPPSALYYVTLPLLVLPLVVDQLSRIFSSFRC